MQDNPEKETITDKAKTENKRIKKSRWGQGCSFLMFVLV
jgi:hypothetical protein